MLAIAWLRGYREEIKKARETSYTPPILFRCPRSCNDGMAVVLSAALI
jgi:hypothetical protein